MKEPLISCVAAGFSVATFLTLVAQGLAPVAYYHQFRVGAAVFAIIGATIWAFRAYSKGGQIRSSVFNAGLLLAVAALSLWLSFATQPSSDLTPPREAPAFSAGLLLKRGHRLG